MRHIRDQFEKSAIRTVSPLIGRKAIFGIESTMYGKSTRKLTAGDTHVAVDSGVPVAPVNHEIMSLGFAGDSGSDCILEVIVALGTTQKRSEVGGVLSAQAHEERSGAG